MKHIVQFSGGAASAYVGWLVVNKYGKENTVLLFHDTKAEHEDAYRFRQQVAEYIGLPITEASDGRSLWEVIYDNHCIPDDGRFPFCTRILKLEPADKFLSSLTEEFTVYNGFGINEWNRVQKAKVRAEMAGYEAKSILCERMISDKEVKRIIRDQWKICLPEPYQHLQHNNCIPCFKGGKGHFFKVWKYYPEQFELAKQVEIDIGHTVFNDCSLSDLEKRWAAGKYQEEMFKEYSVPCMCAV